MKWTEVRTEISHYYYYYYYYDHHRHHHYHHRHRHDKVIHLAAVPHSLWLMITIQSLYFIVYFQLYLFQNISIYI